MKTLDIKKRIREKKKEDFYKAPMVIRDSREHEFFITNDVFVDKYARLCGIYGLGVYNLLCRHSGKDQTCYPSIDLMAYRLNISRGSVIAGLKELEKHRIIQVDRVKGEPNIYTLMNKKKWGITFSKVVLMKKASQSSLEAFRELNHLKDGQPNG